jgi:phosphoglycerate dehydrogenase-like enzyme
MKPLPLVLVDAFPRSKEMIFSTATEHQLRAQVNLVEHYGSRMPDALVDEYLEEVAIIVGQTPMDAARLNRAKKLKAIINVKGNWESNIDYREAQRLGIHVLSIAPVMAPAVAEMCLGMAISLGRGIVKNDLLFRSGTERYGIAGNGEAISLFNAKVGFVGYGNLGRALGPLLAPFSCDVRIYDPWLSNGYLTQEGYSAASLDEVLQQSQYLFLLAGVNQENDGFLSRALLETVRKDACVVLASRAEIVDFEAFLDLAETGQFRAAIDVYPQEPVDPSSPMRKRQSIIFSSHLAGGMRASYQRIANSLMEEIPQLLRDLPPLLLQRAEPRLAAMQTSR